MKENDKKSKVIVVRFALTKGEGEWPSIGELDADEILNPVTMCTFRLDDADVDRDEAEIDFCEILYDGVTWSKALDEGMRVIDGALCGYPTLVIRFHLSKPVAPETFVRSVWFSTVKILPKARGAATGEPLFCEDHNGYTTAISKLETQALLDALIDDGLSFGRKFSVEELRNGAEMVRFSQ